MGNKWRDLLTLGRVVSGAGIGLILANMTMMPLGDLRGYEVGLLVVVLGLLLSGVAVRRA